MDESPPGVLLDDLYRVLRDRDASTVRLLVEAVEPLTGIVHIHYTLVDAAGDPIRDPTGAPVTLVGGVDPGQPLPGLQPGTTLPIPPKRGVSSDMEENPIP